jgi:hypothetical protein
MAEDDTTALLEKAARCRRLALEVTDEPASRALQELAREYQTRAEAIWAEQAPGCVSEPQAKPDCKRNSG